MVLSIQKEIYTFMKDFVKMKICDSDFFWLLELNLTLQTMKTT